MFLELTFKQTALGGGLSVATVGHLCKHRYQLFSLNRCIVEWYFFVIVADCDVVILWHMDFLMIVVVRYEQEKSYII